MVATVCVQFLKMSGSRLYESESELTPTVPVKYTGLMMAMRGAECNGILGERL